MRYDLASINDLCAEIDLDCVIRSDTELAIELERGVSLVFKNEKNEDDCLMGFQGTQWHTHGDLTCSNPQGNYVELNYLDIISGLTDGTVLICELWNEDRLSDRWLVHKDLRQRIWLYAE